MLTTNSIKLLKGVRNHLNHDKYLTDCMPFDGQHSNHLWSRAEGWATGCDGCGGAHRLNFDPSVRPIRTNNERIESNK